MQIKRRKFTSRVLWSSLVLGAAGLCLVLLAPCDNMGAGKNKVVRYNRPQIELANAGFELGQVGWKPIALNLLGAKIESDSSEKTEGKRSLRIDLSQARAFPKAEFRVVSPWLTLSGGGEFEFSAFVKADSPGRRIALRIINGVAKTALRKGKQSRKRFAEDERTSTNWTRIVFSGTLPTAALDAYRLALEFEAPGIYWIDQIEFRHRGKSIRSAPELEAALQPENLSEKLHAAPAQVPVRIWVVNRSDRRRNLQLQLRQSSRLDPSPVRIDLNLEVNAKESTYRQARINLPYADDYRVDWTLLDESSHQVDAGVVRLAATNQQLPAVKNGEPVWGMHLSALNMDVTLPILRQAGVTFLRNIVKLHWSKLEPRPGKWRWPDKLLAYLHSQGFQVLGIVGFPPRWANRSAGAGGRDRQKWMSNSLDDYREYVRQTVARYGSQISHWEIWNEPNLPRYFNGTAQQYGQILEASVSEIKTQQPQTRVAGLSLAWSDPNRLAFAHAAVGKMQGNLEALSFHPYEKTAPEPAQLVEKIAQLQSQYVTLKNHRPELWATETGYRARDSVNQAIPYFVPARPRTVDEMTQAEYIVRHALLAKSAGVKYYFCFSMDSERPGRGPDIDGLLDYDWCASVKPALLAYLTLVQLCGDAVFEQRENLPDREIYLLHFRRSDGRRLSAIWTTQGVSQLVLPADLYEAEAFDLFGNRRSIRKNENVLIRTRPMYFLR